MEDQKISTVPLYQKESTKATHDSILPSESAQLLRLFLHDIKNPLSSLVGYLGLVSMLAKSLDDKIKRYLTSSSWSCNEMSFLCKNIEDSLALESGQIKPQFERLEVAKVLEKEAEQLNPVADFFQKKISLHIQAALPPWQGDKALVARLFRMIMYHCLMHSTTASGVEVLLEQKENALCFQVVDEGPVVEEKNRAIFFDALFPIQCAKGARRPKGWDFYFCKLVTQLHGGQIAVLGEGKKTKFSVVLPYSSDSTGR